MRFGGNKKTTGRRPLRRSQSKTSLNYYRSPKTEALPPTKPSKKNSRARSYQKRVLHSLRNLLLLVVILWVIIHSLILVPSPRISINNATYHSSADYKKAIDREMGSIFNRNKITLNKKAIESKLKRQFPEITSLKISVGAFSQVPSVKLNIDGPSFNLSSGGEIYVVNAQGVAVAKSAELATASKLPNLIDQTNFKVEMGKQVLAFREVDFINNILSQCGRSSVPVASLTLPPLAQELDLRTSDKSYFVKFYLGGDVAQQIGQFLAARHDFDAKDKQPATYLDVRVPGKVYFK